MFCSVLKLRLSLQASGKGRIGQVYQSWQGFVGKPGILKSDLRIQEE